MSDTSTAAPSTGGTPKISKVSEAVIRIAGNSQDGIQAIGGFLARLAGRSEQEVMTWVVSGRLNKQIAGELGTSAATVKVHRGHVMRKMKADSVADLVRMAGRLGLSPHS